MRREQAQRHRHEDRQYRPQRRDVQRLDQRVVHALGIERPGDRPHALEQIGHLLRRIVEEFGDDLHRAQAQPDRGHQAEIEREAREALPRV